MLLIALARLHRFRIILDIVVAVRQRDTALVKVRDSKARVVHVRHRIKAEQGLDSLAMHMGHLRDEFVLLSMDYSYSAGQRWSESKHAEAAVDRKPFELTAAGSNPSLRRVPPLVAMGVNFIFRGQRE